MAAEVSADLALINDEDVLRRMWADTEDFGKKKEIRARMYKLREQRLKDFYTTGDVVTEVTGRKHLTKTHADSISDQGFITMKTKEIRDSESPTRDFSQRAGQGNGYWNSRQENTYASGNDDGARIEMKSNVTEGKGVIKEGNTETQMAMAAHNLHEKSEKSDENMSSKSEHHSHASKLVSTSKTDTGDSSSTVISSAQEQKQSSQSQSEQTSTTTSATSSTTKWSTSSTSSSKRVVSSSSSSKNYQITSGEEVKSIRDVDDRDYRVITSEDDSKYNRRFTDSTQDISRVTDNTTNQEQYQTSRIIKTSNRTSSTTSRDVEDSAPSTYIIRRVVYVTDDDDNVKTNDVNIQNTQIINEKRLTEQNERLHETRDVRDDSRVIQQQNIIRRDFQDQDEQDVVERVIKTSDTKKFITNEKYDTRRKDDTYVTDDVVDDTRVIRETRVQKTNQDDVKQSSTVERANRTDIETSSTVTDQKIMKEIHKLDSYLSSQSTAPSTPVSPQSVITDTANWTVVSSKDGEFVYKGEKPTSAEPSAAPKQKAPTSDDSVPTYRTPTPVQPSPPASTQEIPVHPSSPTPKDSPQSYQPRDKITKHPSSMDHPKEPTDGQYVTTYQQSYNRISVDNSASHEFFASTLRASPDRSTPSPTKRTPSRGSLDRSSPERRMRTPSKGSLDRSSPESKPRGSKGSLVDRTSPERKYKPTPTNLGDRTSPERKYKPTSPNYVDRTSPERKYKPISPNLVDRTSPERKYKPSPTNLSDRTSPERKYKPTSPNFVDRTSPERKYKPISPNLADRTSPERKYKPSPTNLGDRTSPERKPKPTSTKLADRTSPERKYKPTPAQKTPDRERRGSAGTYNPDKTKDTRRKSTDTTRSNSLRETTTKTKRKFSSTQTKAANKARASTPGTSPSTSPTRKYRPKDTTTTTDSDSDVSHGTYKKSTTNITQDIDIQEKTTITSKKDTVVIDDQQDITDQESYPAKPTPRDKSPEYSSEGSVSREIRQNRIRDQPHDSSPERRAFAPIKPIPTTVGEQKDITVNLITNEKHLITNETDEVVEVTEKDNARPFREKPDEPDDDDQPRYDEQRVITETSVTTKRDDVKVTDITNVQRKSPRSSTERIKDTSDSPERKTKPGRRSPSSSPSPERFQTRRPQQPSAQTSKLVTKDHEATVFINEEKRHPSPEKTTDTTTKTTDIRRTSKEVTERLTRKPTQPSRPETTQSTPRSQSPRKKFSSPTESPERPTSSPVSSLSPDRPSSTRRPQQVKPKPVDTPTNVTRHIEVDTHKTTIRKVVSSDTPKTPKKSSIPRSESYKPVPKNQTPKGRPESIGRSPLRKPQTNAPSTPQKQRTPLIERTVVTVTKTTTISDKKPIGKPKDSPSQTSVRRIPSSPRKPATPASVSPAKSTPSYPRKENIPQQKRPKEDSSQITKITREIRRTSEQKENKRPTRPNVEPHQGRHPSSPGKDTKNVKTKKITEVTDFIEHEKPRDTSDIEDEAPPDEFFADTDDDTVPKSSEPLQRTSQVQNIKQTTSRTIKTATVESSEIKRPKDSGTPKKPTQTIPLSKTKQILKESTTVNESPRKIKPDSQQKAPEDSDTSSDSEEEVTVEETVRTTSRQVDQHTINQNSTQDLLNVIVQHPKSSRESSPGYPNARIPVCSTSEDGESIPRYADHISEPEDSDTLERKKPKPYADQRTIEVTDVDDEETVIHTSVADRVTEFLEAAKQTQEIQEQTQQVQIENSKSVLQTKALFENIAKNQTTIQVSTKPVNIYETQPETIPSSLSSKPVKPGREPQQKGPKKETSQPTKVPKPSTKLVEPEPSDDDDDDETFEQTIHSTVTTKTSDSVNVQEQVNYEVDVYEEVEEHDTKTTKSSKPQEPSKISQKPKEPVQKPKEPTRKPQEPAHKKEPTGAGEPKKPLDRKPSGTTISVSSKKDFFERKAQDFDKPKAPLKENIIRSKPQKEAPQGIKPQKPESTEIPDSLTSVTERTESYLRSTVASSVRSQTPDKPHRRDSKPDVLDKLSPTKYEEPERPESEELDDSVTTRTESYLRSTVASTVRSHTPDNLHRRGSKPDVLDKSSPTKPRESHRPESVEPIDSLTSKGLVAERTESYLKNTVASTLRRDSKPDVFDKPSSKHGRPQRPDSTEPQDLVTSKGLVTERTESYLRNTVASTVRSHTPDKPHRREPDVLDKSPSKYDEPEIPESVETHDSVTTRSESYLRSTVASSVRSQTPDKPNRRDSKPDVLDKVSPTKPTAHEKSPTRQIDTGRKPSKPEEPSTRKGSKPTKPEEATKKPLKPEEITRKPSRPEEIVRRPSKPDELTRKPSKPEEIVRKPSKGEESLRRVSKDERPSSPNKKPKERSVSPLKSDERMKSPSKVIEVIKDVRKTSETSTKLSKPDDTVRRPYITTEVIDDTKSISRVKDINTTFKRTEQTVEVAKEGKFGVTLRKTPSSTKVTTVTTTKTSPKKPLAPGELPEVEDIFDLEILEELLLRAVGYDERRRIRAQIRIVKKQLEEEYNTPGKSRTVTTTTTYTSTIPSVKDIKALSPKNTSTSGYVLRTTKVTTEETQKRRPERVSPERQVTKSPERPYSRSPERQSPERSFTTRQSPERQSPERRYIDTKKSETKTESVHTYRKDSLPKTESPERKRQDRQSPEKQVLKTTTTTTVVEQRRSPERKPIIKPEQKAKQQTQVTERTTTTERRVSGGDRKLKPDVENSAVSTRTDKTQITSRDSRSEVYETSTTVKSQSYRQVTSETKETCPTDSITSSYGVGPTDENGRPLFGLKALRRTNTNKSIGENELEEQQITVIEDETDEIYDSNGRPLFGLKALQATTEEDTMPAQTAQLRELVEKHQQYARESSAKETKPVQKPKAKLRDSFILTTDDEATSATTTTTTTTSHPTDDSTRGLSLRSIIKKHEQISSTGGKVESEMESRRTVVHSQSTVSSDGKVTHKRNIVHGEISSKNGEAPVGKITQRTFSYQTPDDKHSLPTIKSTIKTSAIGGGGNVQRRLSGPKIEEIKDDSTTSSIDAGDSTRRYSKEYTVDDSDTVITRNDVRRRSSDINEETSRNYTSILKSSKQDTNDWNTTGSTTVIRRTSGPKLTEFPAEDGLSSKVIRTTTTTTTKTVVSDKDDKRPLGRGDSVKALQHKFQQATEAANQATSRPYPPAGLILRSNSLQKNNDDQTIMSSALKQSNVERTDSRGRIQETKSREIITSSPVISTQVKTLEDTQTVKSSPTTVTRVTTITKGPLQEVTTTKVTEVSSKSSSSTAPSATSFLDDTSKVTGVQDILNRMRNADLVTESSDTSEDAEARALLNKFLGASVILQGMEQGMRSVQQHQHTTTTTTSSEAPSSAALVIQAEKQRVKDANTRTLEDDIDEISDEKQLRILLEACSDYEGRRKIRARLRTIMADHKDITDTSSLASSKDGGDTTKTEVHTTKTTTSTARLTKANSVQSPFAKFKQMERQNSAPSAGRGAPNYVSEPKVVTSVSYVKEHLLDWVKAQTRAYKNVQIENFSTSWSDGLAFCALIHHFCPNAFDYDSLSPQNRRYNFELAFRVAEEEDIYPLLDVEDMVTMRKPDWKCVFTYVQSVYRRFHNSPDALPANPYV